MAAQTTPRVRWWLFVAALVGVVLILGGAVPGLIPSSANTLSSTVVAVLIIAGLIILVGSLLFFVADVLALEG